MDGSASGTGATQMTTVAQLRTQYLQEMRALIEDYTLQKAEIARERDQAKNEAEWVVKERDALQIAYDSEVQRVRETHQALEHAVTELTKKKNKLKATKRALVEAEAKSDKTKSFLKKKLALTTAAMTKRLDQAEERERDERADKEELKRVNEQIIAQSHKFQRELAGAKKTHKEWRLKYSDALTEKIDLLRQYSPTPILPIEVIANIAGFVAGANDYAGLAAMSLASQTMQQELKPILYETVIWNPQFHDRMHGTQAELDASEFRHVRYIVLKGHQYACVETYRTKALPNLRAVIDQDCPSKPSANGTFDKRGYLVGLYILRNTTLGTISSILEQPLDWFWAGEETIRGLVRGIACIEIAANATLSVGDSATAVLFKPLEVSKLTVRLISDRDQGALQRERVETSLSAIRQMMLQPDSIPFVPEVELCVEDPSPANLEVWTAQLRQWLLLKPTLKVQVRIPCDQPEVANFRNMTHQFQAMYELLWQDDPRFNYRYDRNEPLLFLLYTRPSDLDSAFLAASFSRRRGLHGFTVVTTSYPHIGVRAEEVEVVSAHHFVLDDAAGPFDAVDDDTDVSESEDLSDSDNLDDSGDDSDDTGSGGSSRDSSVIEDDG